MNDLTFEQPIKRKTNIIEVRCPNCEHIMYLKKINGEEMWTCSNCPLVLDENYFDVFPHTEKFVIRRAE